MNNVDGRFQTVLPVIATLPRAASTIVSELVGRPVCSVETLRQGLMTFKCLVETKANQRVIVRFYPPTRSSVVDQEPDLLARCRLVGIPVPEVVGDSRSGPRSELAYVVYRMIEGMTLLEYLSTSAAQQHSGLAIDLAKQLQSLQSIEFVGSGELVSSTEAHEATWRSFVETSMQIGLDAVRQHSLLDDAAIDKLSRIADRGLPGSRLLTHRLVWGDINFENIIVDSAGRVVGLIDFESCLSGDPLATLGYCFAAHGPNVVFAELLNVWAEPLNAEDHNLLFYYTILRALRLARYAHLPLPTGYARDPLTDVFPGLLPALEKLDH